MSFLTLTLHTTLHTHTTHTTHTKHPTTITGQPRVRRHRLERGARHDSLVYGAPPLAGVPGGGSAGAVGIAGSVEVQARCRGARAVHTYCVVYMYYVLGSV